MACGETLTAICKDQDMPAYGTVWRWRQENPAFRESYARAREAQMERWADEIVEISDDTTQDMVLKEGRNGSTYLAPDQEHIQRSRLRVDTRKFLMAKIAPALYGERVQVDGQVDHHHTHAVGDLPDRERMRRLATFLAEAPVIEGQAHEVVAVPHDEPRAHTHEE